MWKCFFILIEQKFFIQIFIISSTYNFSLHEITIHNVWKVHILPILGMYVHYKFTNQHVVICARVYLFLRYKVKRFKRGVYKELISISRSHFVDSLRIDVTCSIKFKQQF